MRTDDYFKELAEVFDKKQIKIIKKVFFIIKKDYPCDRYYDIINICCERILVDSSIDYSKKLNLLFKKVREELDLGTKYIRTFSEVDDVEIENSVDTSTIGFNLGEQEENQTDYINDEVLLDLIDGMSVAEVADKYGMSYQKVLAILRTGIVKSRYNIVLNKYKPNVKMKVK